MSLYDDYEPVGKTCAICGKRFILMSDPKEYVYKRATDDRRFLGENRIEKLCYFCSYHCMRDFDRMQFERSAATCPNCGERFAKKIRTQKFCCEDCRRSHTSRMYWERKKERDLIRQP